MSEYTLMTWLQKIQKIKITTLKVSVLANELSRSLHNTRMIKMILFNPQILEKYDEAIIFGFFLIDSESGIRMEFQPESFEFFGFLHSSAGLMRNILMILKAISIQKLLT